MGKTARPYPSRHATRAISLASAVHF